MPFHHSHRLFSCPQPRLMGFLLHSRHPPMPTPTSSGKNNRETFMLYLTQRHINNHTRFILLDSSGDLHSGTQMRPPEEVALITPADLARLPRTPMPTSRYFPLLNASSVTVYTGALDASVYVKKQALLGANSTRQKPEWYKKMLTRELLIADALLAHPHANLCAYRGALIHPVSNRVIGLVYKRYTLDLHQFVRRKYLVSASQVHTIVEGIAAGMKHLHSLGIVHCDLRPVNIFLTLGPPAPIVGGGVGLGEVVEEVVLGDFDACVRVGERIDGKLVAEEFRHKGFGFGMEAKVEVDTFALEEVEKWLWRKLGPEARV
ncbi:hypothetical protein BU23DRAFT_277669 [Bimuria novae-zelandiae CBS 107.79]|uniref:EKC/KEOPS complex subunit BUD32 n=1 Tax=Bimuria novae-zelandiae CBS 107.79 TaxID=1447943 RepID=A0A6A5USP9_9PLEO|nr:hypothetical protein BU23DRAFT_277669 [Bimuria novae-zelandiae CBS 107.79]